MDFAASEAVLCIYERISSSDRRMVLQQPAIAYHLKVATGRFRDLKLGVLPIHNTLDNMLGWTIIYCLSYTNTLRDFIHWSSDKISPLVLCELEILVGIGSRYVIRACGIELVPRGGHRLLVKLEFRQ
jgi:hypothetical protein